MRKLLLSFTALFAFVGFNVPTFAEEAKPVAVVSVVGYEGLINSIDYVGQLVKRPALSKMVEGLLGFFTQGQGLAGLEKTKPWGSAIFVKTGDAGPEPTGYLFFPVDDLNKLMNALAVLQPEEEDGIWHIEGEGLKAYIKEQNGWAFVAHSPDVLKGELPDDPSKLLGTLPKDYDIAAKVDLTAIPADLKQMFSGLIQMGAAQGLQPLPNEDDEAFKARKELTEKQLETVTGMLNEMEAVTVGFSINEMAHKTYLDMSYQVAKTGNLADQLKANSKLSSRFNGFFNREGLLALRATSVLTQWYIDYSLESFEAVRKQVSEQISKANEIPDEEAKKLVTGMINVFFDVIEATIKSGKSDAALSISGDGPLSLIGAGHVSDAKKIEKQLRDLAEKAPKDEHVEIKFDDAKEGDVAFHTVTVKVPEEVIPQEGQEAEAAKQALKLVGNPVVLTIGIGTDSFYYALGADGVANIKKAMKVSKDRTKETVPPSELTVSLMSIMKIAAQFNQDGNPAIAMAAMALQGGDDHIIVTSQINGNTARARIEIEEGIYKLIGAFIPAEAGEGIGAGEKF